MSATLFYTLLASGAFIADRASKWYALQMWVQEQVIAPFLSFQVAINRGISWGLLQHAHQAIFVGVSMLILAVTGGLIVYASRRYNQGYSIVGEVLVVSGSCSNILDRYLYGGVVDFIMFHKGSLTWPLFNIADSCIVLGVLIMVVQLVTVYESA